MFDELFGVSVTQLRDNNTAHVTNLMAVIIVLMEKGIVTHEELAKASIVATHVVEQAAAKLRDEANAEYDEEHPGVRDMLEKLTSSL